MRPLPNVCHVIYVILSTTLAELGMDLGEMHFPCYCQIVSIVVHILFRDVAYGMRQCGNGRIC